MGRLRDASKSVAERWWRREVEWRVEQGRSQLRRFASQSRRHAASIPPWIGVLLFAGFLLGLATELDETVNEVLGGGVFAQAGYGGLFMLLTFTCTTVLYRHAVQWSRSGAAPISTWPSAGAFATALALVMMPTMGVALVAAVLVRTGVIGVTGTSASDVALTRKIFVTLLWHLADAIPLLDIPNTLNWKARVRFPSVTGGAVVLAYKLILIVPAIHLGGVALRRLLEGGSQDSSLAIPDRESGRSSPPASRS